MQNIYKVYSKIGDSDGEIRGLALHLLFEDFDNELEIKLD